MQQEIQEQSGFADVTRRAAAARKVALFRSLFKGRDDVFARRFESARSGRSGYQPACANEWRAGLCDKRQTACATCPNRQFVPLSDALVTRHLTGLDEGGKPFVMGVYPLLADETKPLTLSCGRCGTAAAVTNH